MPFDPGSVVALKSGGQPLTVVATNEHGVQCLWIGEEGDLFSATIPAVALEEWDADLDDEDDEEETDPRPAALETVSPERHDNAA
jgi:hypothetical protein